MDKIIKDNDDDKEIKVKDINFNNWNSITKTVVDNNNCSFIFDKNSKLLDTGNVKSMIKAKKIPGCSILQQDNIINLNLDKVDGCEFYLISESPSSFSKSTLSIDLTFLFYDYKI